MSECILCKIKNLEIPNYTVYEDDYVLAFLDINPHAKGHTVVIPKKHIENLKDVCKEDWSNVLEGVRQATKRIEEVLKPDGINIGINDREVAGQVVPHIHFHIFPRFDGDGGGSIHSIINNKGEVEVEEVAKLFNQ